MLLREGAGEGALGFTGAGSPVFSLMTDETTQDFLLTDDPAVRSDFQFAYEGKGEGSPRGPDKSYYETARPRQWALT